MQDIQNQLAKKQFSYRKTKRLVRTCQKILFNVGCQVRFKNTTGSETNDSKVQQYDSLTITQLQQSISNANKTLEFQDLPLIASKIQTQQFSSMQKQLVQKQVSMNRKQQLFDNINDQVSFKKIQNESLLLQSSCCSFNNFNYLNKDNLNNVEQKVYQSMKNTKIFQIQQTQNLTYKCQQSLHVNCQSNANSLQQSQLTVQINHFYKGIIININVNIEQVDQQGFILLELNPLIKRMKRKILQNQFSLISLYKILRNQQLNPHQSLQTYLMNNRISFQPKHIEQFIKTMYSLKSIDDFFNYMLLTNKQNLQEELKIIIEDDQWEIIKEVFGEQKQIDFWDFLYETDLKLMQKHISLWLNQLAIRQ